MKKILAFILFCFIASFVFAESPGSATIPDFEIPDWASLQIKESLFRFEQWRGNDQTVVFPLITDIHAARPLFANPPNFEDTKYHVLLAQYAAKLFKADFFADLGDIGFDRDLQWKPSKKADAEKRLQSQVALYKDSPIPILFCMGNHDCGRAYGKFFSELRLSTKDYGSMFNGMIKRRGFPLVTGPNDDYGCYDVPDKKCRVFFLNTSEQAERGYSLKQMQFLADHLQMPENYTAIVLQHICIHPTIGKWLPVHDSMIPNADLCFQILTGFNEKTKGESKTVKWDFTQNKRTKFAAIISGDSHFNNQTIYKGVNMIITQGYGTISDANIPECVDYVKRVNRKNSMILDIAAIKPHKGEMKLFRIGAGGADRDRTFHF